MQTIFFSSELSMFGFFLDTWRNMWKLKISSTVFCFSFRIAILITNQPFFFFSVVYVFFLDTWTFLARPMPITKQNSLETKLKDNTRNDRVHIYFRKPSNFAACNSFNVGLEEQLIQAA